MNQLSRVALLLVTTLAALNARAATRYVSLNSPSPVPPYTNWATAATNIQNAVDAANPGDLVLVTNGIYRAGGRVANGLLTNRVVVNKPITVQSVNGAQVTLIEGYQVPATTNGDSAVRCVYLTNGARLIGFTLTQGATRAVFAVLAKAENAGGGAWCESTTAVLSNCVLTANSAYGYGGGTYSGTLYSCLIVSNFVQAYSPGSDLGSGGGTVAANLNNCIVKSNSAGNGGGGAYGGTLNDCMISGNSADFGGGAASALAGVSTLNRCLIVGNSANFGGGVSFFAPMSNCLIISNSANYSAGGALGGLLNNCDIIANSAPTGGGTSDSALRNCIVYFNTAADGTNYNGGSLTHCCTIPFPDGAGNITNEPLLFARAAGDFHLQSNSPCINAGNNVYVTNSADLDGNPRISGGTVDIGAYEFQSPSSILSYAWAQQYGLPTDGSADFSDPDADGMNNWQEWIAGTDPTNSASLLKLYSPSNNAPGLKVSWQSVSGETYFLLRGTSLAAQPPLTPLRSNITGQAGTTIYTDTTATNLGPYFYRVGMQ